MSTKNRINFLDGFRGLAILLVIFYHAYSRWSFIVPYGYKYSLIVPFKQGFLGVQLFFLISGFVILMSLEKSKNFSNFIYKRWIRLFPAMLIATIIIFITVGYFPERPFGMPVLKDVVSGLIFIQPTALSRVTGLDFGILEGTFWSLFVEVKFYLIFGVLYFYLGTRKSTLCLSFIYFAWYIIEAIGPDFYPLNIILAISHFIGFGYYGWFASGAFAYLYYLNRSNKDLLYSILIGVISTLMYHNDIVNMIFMSLLLVSFISAIYFEKLRDIFDNTFFVFFGFISYPLYLIHENAMIALTIKLGRYFNFIPDILLPILPILGLSIIAYIIAKIMEPLVRKALDSNIRLLLSTKKAIPTD